MFAILLSLGQDVFLTPHVLVAGRETHGGTTTRRTRNLSGFNNFGIDEGGNYVFFGLETPVGTTNFTTNYQALGQLIQYLQRIATEAQQRRLSIDPNKTDLEVRKSQSNPVARADLTPDIIGATASLLCTRQDNYPEVEAQLNFDTLQGFLKHLPSTIAEMEKRQAALRHGH